MSGFRVGLFSECYQPIQNGIVTSLITLTASLRARDRAYVVVTPEMPRFRDVDRNVSRVASLPLPTRTAYRLTVPYLSRDIGGVSVVHAHSAFVTGWLALRTARRACVPLVFTYHTQLEAYAHYVPLQPNVARAVATRLTRAYANAADAVIVPTRAMNDRLRAMGVRSRIEVVPTGIDVARFARGSRSDDVRARLGVAREEFLILCVGRLGREKNVELALHAFARLDEPRARLVIVGDGAHRAALERECVRANIGSRVSFAGELPRDALPDVYASADAFVFTSHSETQGLVLVEALASGVPIVAIDAPQTADVLGDMPLVIDDADAVAAALRRELAQSAPRLGSSRTDRRRSAAARFDGDRLGERIISIYDSLATPLPIRRFPLRTNLPVLR